MNSIKFCKFHGFGNDYIVFEADDLRGIENLGEFAKRVCHRNTGIGGDGIAVLEKSSADFSCRIFNPDGSEAGFSGNGTRCAAAYLYHSRIWASETLKLETKSGIKTYELLENNGSSFRFLAKLGTPKSITSFELTLTDGAMPIISLDVGNPVAVIFVKDFAELDWRKIGAEIEGHPRFPERTNVVFVKVLDESNIEIRIWERGAGETSSSGTCSIAAAVASVFSQKTGRDISVHAAGGTTEAVWRDDGEMTITGRADLAFRGEWFAESN